VTGSRYFKPNRSNHTMQIIKASVMAVTARRAVQLIPRLTHHSSAQLITTGTMISSCNAPRSVAVQRVPLEPPAPMPTAPPIFTQVSVPSTLANPGPEAAHALPEPVRFTGTSLPDIAGLSGLRAADGSATTCEPGTAAIMIAKRMFRIPPFIARVLLVLQHDAETWSRFSDKIMLS
jgi:hypothetical protein